MNVSCAGASVLLMYCQLQSELAAVKMARTYKKVRKIHSLVKGFQDEQQRKAAEEVLQEFFQNYASKMSEMEKEKNVIIKNIRANYQMQLMMIPKELKQMTIGELIKNGSQMSFTTFDNASFIIPRAIFVGSGKTPVKTLRNRTVNSFSNSVITTNKKRAPKIMPISTVLRRKTVHQEKRKEAEEMMKDLKEQCKLKMLELENEKSKAISEIRDHFSKMILSIPDEIKGKTMKDLMDTGLTVSMETGQLTFTIPKNLN